MKYVLLVIAMLFFWEVGQVSAQNYPPGYETVYSPPVAGMISLNTQIQMGILVPTGSYGLECQQVSARIEAYIVWINPTRPPEYWVKADSLGLVVIWNRETIDSGGCK